MGTTEDESFLAWLFDRAGLRLEAYRRGSLVRRLPACRRLLRSETLLQARKRIEADPSLLPSVVSVLLLGVTEFRRDPLVFSRIECELLPALLRENKSLRCWSAACADGSELYSVAMLLSERRRLQGCELLGTDVRAEAIQSARLGEFDPEAPGLPSVWREIFFESRSGRLSARADIRRAISWKLADLLQSTEPGPWDLILWRNLAIYFEEPTAASVWHRLAAELAPGGYLVVGKADYPPADLRLNRVAPCIFRRCRP